MKRIIVLFFLVIPTILLSQSENTQFFTISGKIIDSKTKKPLEAASIVFRDTSNKIINGGISNHRGNFSVEVAEGTYKASVEYISYISKELNISSIARNLNIGTVALEVDTEFLNEVEIVAEKKSIEFKPNKMVINVSKDIASAGGLATDILNNIPSVNVNNGNVLLKGMPTTVMINGRVSPKSGGEALKTIPANTIEKVEVITNPGANYSASYNSIVNIILKKGKNNGFNASVRATAGSKDIYGGLATLNYKTKKYNVYSTINYGHSNPITVANYNTEYFENSNTSSYLNEFNQSSSINNNLYGLLGVEVYVSDKTTITPQIKYNYLDYTNNSATETEILNASSILQSSNVRNFKSDFNNEILEYSINFEHHFNEGKTLKAHYSFYDDDEDFDKIVTNTNNNFTSDSYIEKNKLKSSEVEVKYNHVINDNKSYALGYKGEYGSINFLNTEENAINNIDYNEDIHGVFAKFDNQINSFYYEIGLRAEFSKYDLFYKDLNTSQTKEYNDLFPSAYLSYDFSETKALSLNFSKSIGRPSYTHLQPFEQKFSETSSYIGNENLEPLYMYQNELIFSYFGNKVYLFPTLFYNIYDNYWQNITFKTGENFNGADKLISTVANVGKLTHYGLNLSIQYNPSKVLSFSGNVLLAQMDQTGVFKTVNNANENIEIDYTDGSFGGNFSLLTQVKIPKLFNFQTNVTHYLESEGAVSVRKAYTYATAALTKDLFNDNATLSLNIDDIFLSNKTNRDRYSEDYFQKTKFKNKYRTIKLSFTYRFNQTKKQRKINFDKKNIKPKY